MNAVSSTCLTTVMFSHQRDDWETPQDLFDRLNARYNFQLDVCATLENHKCKQYITKQMDGLAREWSLMNWMNPPYGRQIAAWVQKANKCWQFFGQRTVALLPARTDTRWFHEDVLHVNGVDIEFLRGRLTFVGAKWPAPFPSMIVYYGVNK